MGGQTYGQKAQTLEIRSDTYNPDQRGMEAPSGKKYSYQRAVRPSRSIEQPVVRESEAFTKQTDTPPVTPQPPAATLGGGSAALDKEDEYRQFKAELEKKKQEEKMERLRKKLEAEQMGK